MENNEIKRLIEAGLEDCVCYVFGDGRHFDAIIISALFEGLSPVKKQQMVYAMLKTQIATGDIHALSLKTYTPSQWQAAELRHEIEKKYDSTEEN